MAINNQKTDQNLLMDAVQRAVQHAAHECAEEAVREFESKMAKRLQSIGLDICSQVSIQAMRNDIVITLKNKLKD